jgi:hypothetical protein
MGTLFSVSDTTRGTYLLPSCAETTSVCLDNSDGLLPRPVGRNPLPVLSLPLTTLNYMSNLLNQLHLLIVGPNFARPFSLAPKVRRADEWGGG